MSGRRDVIRIMCDRLRADHLPRYAPATPPIEALAARMSFRTGRAMRSRGAN